MAITGRGDFPFRSSWFTPRYNPPYKSLHILRRSIGIDRDVIDNTIWTDYFFAAGSTAISGTAAITQAIQTIVATGAVGVVAITGTGATAQAIQAIAAVGAETFSGTAVFAQVSQSIEAIGSESFIGNGVLSQATQTIVATGTVASNAVTGDITINQLTPTIEITGTVDISTPAAVDNRYQRSPLFLVGLYPEKQKRQLRFLEIEIQQADQHIEGYGTVEYIIRGETNSTGKAQVMTASGRKSTFERDMKAILELIELEAA